MPRNNFVYCPDADITLNMDHVLQIQWMVDRPGAYIQMVNGYAVGLDTIQDLAHLKAGLIGIGANTGPWTRIRKQEKADGEPAET